jgi:hypothetical protein
LFQALFPDLEQHLFERREPGLDLLHPAAGLHHDASAVTGIDEIVYSEEFRESFLQDFSE